MTDKDYWKKKYSSLWDKSSKREEVLKIFLENETGLEIEYYGEGAGSSKYIHGSAKDNGFKKGAPDLHIIGTDIYIEVTGSFSGKTKAGDDLWFRPDKLNYAHMHLYDQNEFLANNFVNAQEWYVIHYDEDLVRDIFEKKSNNKDYISKEVEIRGSNEKYIAIKSNNPNVKTLSDLVTYLRSVKENMDHSQDSIIKKIRLTTGMSQSVFAKYFSIPLATLQDWEHKRRNPPIYIPNMMLRILKLENYPSISNKDQEISKKDSTDQYKRHRR